MDKYCKLTRFYDEPKHKYNLITTVIFFSNTISYKVDKNKSSPYHIYFTGLNNNINDFYKYFDYNFYYRIYFDNSILKKIIDDDEANIYVDKFNQILEDLKKKPRIQLVHYDCPKFKIDKFHKGLFGTVMRFDPLFTKENTNLIFISDIEKFTIVDIKYLYEYLKLYNADSVWRNSMFGYEIDVDFRKTQSDWIFAGNFGTKIKLDPSILNQFFKDYENPKSKLYSYINNIIIYGRKDKGYGKEFGKIKYTDKYHRFVYGFDEALLNFYLKPKLNDTSVLLLTIPRLNSIFSIFYKTNNKLKNLTTEQNNNVNEFFNLIFEGKINFKLSARQNFFYISGLIIPLNFRTIQIVEKNLKKNIDTIIKNKKKYLIPEKVLLYIKVIKKMLNKIQFIKKYKYNIGFNQKEADNNKKIIEEYQIILDSESQDK